MPRPKRTKVAPSVLGQKAVPNTKPRQTRPPHGDDENTTEKQTKGAVEAKPVGRSTRRSTRLSGNDVDLAIDQAVASEESGRKRGRATSRLEAENLKATAVATSNTTQSPEVGASKEPSGGSARRGRRQSGVRGRQLARDGSNEPELPPHRTFGAIPPMQPSILATGQHIRRRRRQPSIIGSSRARSSSVGMEAELSSAVATPQSNVSSLRTGTIRRRQRQPSIIGSAQRPSRALLMEQEGNGSEDEDEDDFNPQVQVESTPLDPSARAGNDPQSTPSAPSSAVSNPRKRKLANVQVPASQSQAAASSDSLSSPPASSVIEQERVAATQSQRESQRFQTPERGSDIMAPPASSTDTAESHESPESSPEVPPPGRRVMPARGAATSTRQTRSTVPATQDSPLSSPPSLTHSPNGPYMGKSRARSLSPSPITLSTAQLQSMLPRRRPRRHRADDHGMSDDDQPTSRSRPSTNAPDTTKRRSARTNTAAKASAPVQSSSENTTTAGAGRRRRTYGRAISIPSDREASPSSSPTPVTRGQDEEAGSTEVEDDSLGPDSGDTETQTPENSQELEARVGKELKDAVRKFAEIDKWELDFEDCSGDASSLQDAR